MTKPNFTTTIEVDQSAELVFNAINNVRAWWSEEIKGNTEKLNDEWDYHYQDVHRCKMKITELLPNKKIVWLVMDNHFSFTKNKEEWKNNQIVFEISEINGKTHVKFTQIGLTSDYECYDICQNAWTTYIQKSLYSLITTGIGQPNGKDKPQTEDEKNLASNFSSTFFVDQTPEEAFNAINNVSAWWQGEVIGSSKKEGDEFDYRMSDIHYSKQKLVEFVPFERITWLITDSSLSFVDHKSEWTGTKIVFEIKSINNKTQVRFTHYGLIPEFECYEACSGAWEQLMQESLHSLITTGKGKNVFG